MARIAVGGVQHETNRFAPRKGVLRDFVTADEWPDLTRGVVSRLRWKTWASPAGRPSYRRVATA